ncbi:MAG: GatB/YqeY domain-containing protein [Ignavibacteriae bacterium]|nr:GatB/YqeY domain-containing protein [Ignavibacteriota bacterium]NOH00319.1 GatB/YqeY domain-containing protein [Ignavibacteriota bacterium]
MKLKDKITDDLKSAMKSKDKIRLETVRSIRALILEHEKSGAEKELTPEQEINLLTSAAKKRAESIEQFSNANRKDLADKEKTELAIIQEYLPKQLSEEEIIAEVKAIAQEIGAEDKSHFAKLMPAAIKKLKGSADGKAVKSAVEKVLS